MKTIETERFRLIVHNNLVKEVIAKSGNTLVAEDVQLSTKLALKVRPGAKFYTLVSMEPGASVSAEAKKETFKEEYILHHEALAICSPDEDVAIDNAVFELVHKYKVPFHFFTDRDQAWNWLQNLAARTWKNFETPSFGGVIHDNLLKELYVKDGVEFSVGDMKLSQDMSQKYKPGAKFYTVLFEGVGSSISLDARRAAGHDEYEKHTAAFAVCSKNIDVAIRSNLFEKMYNPRIPFQVFDDRDKALFWLRNLMKES